MAYTSNKKLSAQAAGTASGTWGAGGTTGDDLNTGVIGPLDAMLAGVASFSLSSSAVSLTFVAGGTGSVQQAMWRFIGTLLSAVDCTPAGGDATTYFNGFYYFENLTTGNFALTVTTAAGSCTLPQGRRGCMFVDATNGPRVVSLVGSSTADPVPAGSITTWFQAAAPAGWTQVTTYTDYALRIVNTTGGGTGGSVLFSTLFARTGTDAVTLIAANLPPHSHTDGAAAVRTFPGTADFASTYWAGSTGSTGTGTGLTSTPFTPQIDMRVKYLDLIVASRD